MSYPCGPHPQRTPAWPPAGLPLSVEFPPPDAATDERAWAALVHGNARAWLDRYYARRR